VDLQHGAPGPGDSGLAGGQFGPAVQAGDGHHAAPDQHDPVVAGLGDGAVDGRLDVVVGGGDQHRSRRVGERVEALDAVGLVDDDQLVAVTE
jgi:hypothetical protein